MIISTDVEKSFDKIEYPFMINTPKMDIEVTYLNITKVIHDKTIAITILNGEKLKAFSVRSGKRQGCLLSPLQQSFGIIHGNQRRKRSKGNTNWKRSSTVTVCRYIKDPTDSARKLLELNGFGKVSGHKINTKISVAFL